MNTQSDENGMGKRVRSRLELTVCLWTACFQTGCEDSAGQSGPRTAPEPGELKLSAGGIWCLAKNKTKKKYRKKNTENRKQYEDVFVEFYYHVSITGLWLQLITFSGNECGLALVTGSSHVHSFNVKQVALMGLQENLLLAACDARDGPGIHQWESE